MTKGKSYYIFILIQFAFIFASCRGAWGDHSLGNNFSLLEGDKTEDRIVVYCTNTSGGVCNGGIPIVPTYNRQYRDGKYAEYVKEAKSNENWIAAKTLDIKNKKDNYWIISKNLQTSIANCEKINCDSVIQAHVIGPLTLTEFTKKVKDLKVDLVF
jgi:hypothetical protein